MINDFKGVSADSRHISQGYIFVAINGDVHNGEDYINQAIENGATCIVLHESSSIKPSPGIEFYYVENPRIILSELAAHYYPNYIKHIVAVTGTNGKTSTAHFFGQICAKNGFKAATVGTNGVIIYGQTIYHLNQEESSLTSPDPVTLHKILHHLSRLNVTHVALEASSHGLTQHRLDHIKIQAGCFTNLAPEHLDYHHNMDNYLAAKSILFNTIIDSTAAINTNSQYSAPLLDICKKRGLNIIEYGKKLNNKDSRKLSSANALTFNTERSQLLEINYKNQSYSLPYTFEVAFQYYNLLGAIALSLACGLSMDDISEALREKPFQASGRMEKVAEYKGAEIFVDFAHTPDALESVLLALRETCKSKLIVIFGCGGDRDKSKRKPMGEIASQVCDIVIITDDNPRFEDPASIRTEIMQYTSLENTIEIPTRAAAIQKAISLLGEGDRLIVAGRGHESYQLICGDKIPLNDKEEIIKIVNA